MDSPLTGQQIIIQLRAEKEYLNKAFGVVEIGLFGSFAGGHVRIDGESCRIRAAVLPSAAIPRMPTARTCCNGRRPFGPGRSNSFTERCLPKRTFTG
ncbi:MAG: hypothetical protein RBT11_16750 [Desulfobacterales bacterium]|nr:hypothetical protein [Desulfobacterales bacterium]